MNTRLLNSIKKMDDPDKIELLDFLLEEFQMNSPEIEETWIKEAEKRLEAYLKNRHDTISYKDIINKYS